MTTKHRLIVNTLSMFFRSILSICFTLLSSRWVLNSLGQIDFGLYALMVTMINFIVFFNALLSDSASRQYAFAIGKGDESEINTWFNTALGVHMSLAVILVLIGFIFGPMIIKTRLSIPVDRLDTTITVFYWLLLSAFVSMLSVPFIAMFTAKQHISELAGWEVLTLFLTFILAWYLKFVKIDMLVFYSVGTVMIQIVIRLIQIFRGIKKFTECKINVNNLLDRRKMTELFSFAGWNLFGGLGVLFRNQGCAVLLNVNYGPKMNAAYGVANQVANASNLITTAMAKAFAPEITTSAGNQNNERMLKLAQVVNKYGTIMLMVIAIPLIVEMDKVLHFWLISPPDFAITLCQLFLGMCLVDRLTTGYMLAVSASGKIAGYQTTLGLILMATLPLAWAFIKLGFVPTSVGIAFIITTAICSFGRVLWVSYLFRIKLNKWFKEILFPCSIAALITIIVSYTLKFLDFNTIYLFSLKYILSVFVSISIAFLIVLNSKEKSLIINSLQKKVRTIAGVSV